MVMETLEVYGAENLVIQVSLTRDLEQDVLLIRSEQVDLVWQPHHLPPLMMTRVTHTWHVYACVLLSYPDDMLHMDIGDICKVFHLCVFADE